MIADDRDYTWLLDISAFASPGLLPWRSLRIMFTARSTIKGQADDGAAIDAAEV